MEIFSFIVVDVGNLNFGRAVVLLWSLRENLFSVSPSFLWMLTFLALVYISFCLTFFITSPFHVSLSLISLCLCLMGIPVMTFTAYPDNPGQASPLKIPNLFKTFAQKDKYYLLPYKMMFTIWGLVCGYIFGVGETIHPTTYRKRRAAANTLI